MKRVKVAARIAEQTPEQIRPSVSPDVVTAAMIVDTFVHGNKLPIPPTPITPPVINEPLVYVDQKMPTPEIPSMPVHDCTACAAVATCALLNFATSSERNPIKERIDAIREMMQIAQDKNITLAAVTAFRGSAKSTIYSLAYPIWSVLGDSRRRYVLIVCQTQQLAQQTLTNIKQELLVNQMIAKDYCLEKSQKLDEWNANTIVIPQYDARISAISIGESIRGLRHR